MANRNKLLIPVKDQINIFFALCFQDTIVSRGHCSHHLLTVDVIKTNITSILHFNCIIPPTTQWYFQTFFKIHVFAITFSKYKGNFRKEYSVVTRDNWRNFNFISCKTVSFQLNNLKPQMNWILQGTTRHGQLHIKTLKVLNWCEHWNCS